MALMPRKLQCALHAGLILLVLVFGSIAAQQEDQRPPGLRVVEAISPRCQAQNDGSITSALNCAGLLSEAASGNDFTNVWGNPKAFIPGCCQDLNDLSKPGYTEECGCAFVKFSEEKKLPMDSRDCSLTRLKARCDAKDEAARREEERRREEALRKLGPCERLLQRLTRREAPRISPVDVPACGLEILTCKRRCSQLRRQLATCDGVVRRLAGGLVEAARISPADVAACGVELFKCKGGCQKQ